MYYEQYTRNMIQEIKKVMIEINQLILDALDKKKSNYRTGACRSLSECLSLIEGITYKINYNEFKENHNKNKEYRDAVREVFYVLGDINNIWDSIGICGEKPSILK